MIVKTIITATLEGTAVVAAPCRVCRALLEPLVESHRIDLATDGESEFLLFTPRLSADQLASLRAHRDCLLATVITMTTRQFFVIERQRPDGTWYPFDFRLTTFVQAPIAWQALIEGLQSDDGISSRATWFAGGVVRGHYPV